MELELVDKKLGKALDKTNKENVKKVIIVGEKEVAKNQITIKDMETGEETVESFVFNNTPSRAIGCSVSNINIEKELIHKI